MDWGNSSDESSESGEQSSVSGRVKSLISNTSGSDGGGVGIPVFIIAALLAIGVFVWVLRPKFQPLWYEIRYESIGTFAYLGLTIVVSYWGLRILKRGQVKKAAGVGAIAVVLLVLTLISPYVAGVAVQEDLSSQTMEATPTSTNLSEAPSVDTNNIRMMTFKGAKTQASTSFNNPTHELSGGELVKRDGALTISYAQEPEGLWKTFTRKQAGAVFVDVNSTKPQVDEVQQQFKCGRGMEIFDSAKFQIQKDNMNTKLVNPTTFQASNGELYNLYSGVQHKVKFKMAGVIPILYSVPEYSSVHLSDVDCNQERLTPSEAVNDSRMDGLDKQQFYPYSLMRYEVISTNYQHGWLNTITDKNDMKAYPSTPSIDNKPPYTLLFEDGSYGQVLTMEAIGDGSGVFEVYIGDGRTGEKKKFEFNTTKKGPGYAADAVITANSERFGAGNKLTVSEVYPAFINGELWYQVNAVQSGTGIYGYTAFYNPGEDTLLKGFNDKQVKSFYTGEYKSYKQPNNTITPPTTDQQSTRNVTSPTLWVVIDDAGGDTYTVPVSENESVTVEQEEPGNETNSTA